MVNENPWSRKPAWSDEDIERAIEQHEIDEMEADEMRAIAEHKEREAELHYRRDELHKRLCDVRSDRRKLAEVLLKQQRYLANAREGRVVMSVSSEMELLVEIRATQARIRALIDEAADLLDELDATNAESDVPWRMDLDDIPPQPAAA